MNTKLNVLDRLVSWVSPSAGVRRARARAVQEVLLSYEGVRSPRRQGGWHTTGASGNAEIGPARQKLTDNARDLARNNAYAKKAVTEWAKRVVGYGITPQADTGNEALNTVIDDWWKIWILQCCSDRRLNFYGAQRMIVRTAYESGECLVRLWDRSLSDNLSVPFQIQLLEGDYIDASKVQTLPSGYIIHGVQFDSIGRIQGYWMYGQHPGDVTQTSVRGLDSRFIPADFILHHAELERPGDVRAVTKLAAVINKLRDLDEYGDAEIVRKKIEACLAMFVGQSEELNGPTLGPITDSDGRKIEKFEPGMIAYGQAGQKPEFFSPTTSGDYAAHKKCELREVAVGTDIPYVLLDDNLEAVNYSSFRGGLLSFRDRIEEYRWNWLIPQVLDPIWAKFVRVLAMMGEIPEPNTGVKWNPPPFDLLDREAEAKADQIELQIGKKTWPQLVGDQGVDARKQIKEITEWKPQLEAAGVTFGEKVVKDGDNQAPSSTN